MKSKMIFVASANRFRVASTCPCGKSNKDQKFSPLKNDYNAGFCHSCGKTFYGKEDKTTYDKSAPIYEQPTYHLNKTMDKTLIDYNENNFIKFCKLSFPTKDVESLARMYGIGSTNHFNGKSTIFWQKDERNRIRGGKVIKYNSTTGNRVKGQNSWSDVTWMHTILKLPNFKLKQCLFGLHLIAGSKKVIAIVESEKTAFIMSLIDDTRLWLATGGKNNFKYDILKCLKGFQIEAYPDNGEFEIWKNIAYDLERKGINIKVSRRLEKTENPNGWDLADEFIRKLQSTSEPEG